MSVTLFLLEFQEVIKKEEKLNYTVEDYKKPNDEDLKKDPKTNKPMYRRKVIYGKDGTKHIITLGILNKPGIKGGHTQITSKWTKKE